MDNGPVVSRIYELILDEPAPGTESVWRSHISPPANWDVQLMREPTTEELSRAEEDLIGEIFENYGKMNRWDLVNLSHQFPEWRDPDGSALPISYEDILRAGNKTEEEIEATGAELGSLAAAESLLQPA
jgi:hypothetical protein